MNKIFKKVLCTFLICGFLFPSIVLAEEGEVSTLTPGNIKDKVTPIWVTAEEGLNIRQTPGLGKDPIDAVPYQAELAYFSNTPVKNWVAILYDNRIRYVCSDYITFNKEELNNDINYNNNDNNENLLEEETIQPALTYYGNCQITFYCPCEICCGNYATGYTANGSLATSNHTVASGEGLPFGTRLLIDGQEFVVEDRGVGDGCIDIFVDSHEEALMRGMYYTDVYIID